MKRCVYCHVLKDEGDFINDDGKELKTCHTCLAQVKAWRTANKEKCLERGKSRYKANKELFKEQGKQRYVTHKEEIKKQVKIWREKNREKCRGYDKAYRNSIAKFSLYHDKLTVLEAPKEGEEGRLLVKCARCQEYFSPTYSNVKSRVASLEGKIRGESRLYCSEECKDSCEVFNVKSDLYARHASVERDSAWARRIKKAAKYTCERCGPKENLEAHHEIPVKVDQSLVNDETNGICLCHECHMKAHFESGCTLVDLRKL